MYRPVRILVVTSLVLLATMVGSFTSKADAQSRKKPPTLLQLIHAIGHSEGWGVEWRRGRPYLDKYNPRTIAPFGMIYEFRGGRPSNGAKAWFKLRSGHTLTGTDAEQALKYIILKLVNKYSRVYVQGLVRRDGTINLRKLRALQRKWAPVGAGNDPNNLNVNWFDSVRGKTLSRTYTREVPSRPEFSRAWITNVFKGNPIRPQSRPPGQNNESPQGNKADSDVKINQRIFGYNADDLLGIAILVALIYLIIHRRSQNS